MAPAHPSHLRDARHLIQSGGKSEKNALCLLFCQSPKKQSWGRSSERSEKAPDENCNVRVRLLWDTWCVRPNDLITERRSTHLDITFSFDSSWS